jgi:hypothetical protein
MRYASSRSDFCRRRAAGPARRFTKLNTRMGETRSCHANRVGHRPPKEPDLPPEKTQAALKKQLSTLDSLRGRNYRDAEHEETEWVNLTLNILTRGFGEA